MSYKDRGIYGMYKNYNEQESPEPRLMGADAHWRGRLYR